MSVIGESVLSNVARGKELVQEQYLFQRLVVENNVLVHQPKRNHAMTVNVKVGENYLN